MEVEFRLPDLGEGVADAEIVSWHVAVGDEVSADDPLLDVQTDKAIVEIPSPHSGKVLSLGAAEEDTVAVGTVLISFEVEGSAAPQPAAAESPPDPPSSAEPSSAAAAAPASPAEPGGAASTAALASPAVRKLARERGIDLGSLSGSGPRGRILESDLDSGPADPPAAGRGEARPGPAAGETVPLAGPRRIVAEAMSEAWRTIPHITDVRAVEVDGLLRARRLLKQRIAERGGDAEALTVFALLAKVTADVAARHPAVNASVDLEQRTITYHRQVDLNVAVSTPQGLRAPVVRAADQLSLEELAAELSRLANAAREGSLAPVDLARGTLTASNYGSLGSPSGTTIVQPGQTAVVGFGRAIETPVVRDGAVAVGTVMQVHCSADHRAMDGLELQAFTAELAAAVEDPVLLLAGGS